MKQVRAMRVSLEDIISGNNPDASVNNFVTPEKATILSYKAGTLVEENGQLYLVTMGEWFKNGIHGLPQVSAFNQLQDLNFTEIKDKVVRNADEQIVESKSDEPVEEIDEVLPADQSDEGQSEDRTDDV